MPDPTPPRKPRRAEIKPSDWSPRPYPQPAPERRTADPVTHSLKELAARTQRAFVADATRVVPPPVAPRSDVVLPPAVGATPTRLDRGLRGLDPAADQAHYEALEAERQKTTIADKVRRRVERAALVARGRAAGARASDQSQGALTLAANRLEQFSRDIELARVSHDVYRPKDALGGPPVGWTRLSDHLDQLPTALRDETLWRNDQTGYFAGLYREADDLGGRVVLAFRGTDNVAGWGTDIVQSAGRTTDQYERAGRLTQRARRVFGPDLLTTGHSLGGGLATKASALAGLRGATFNPAGLNPASLLGSGKEPADADELLTTYHTGAEMLSSVQSPLGRTVVSPLATVVKLGMAATGTLGRPTARGDFLPGTIPGPTGQYVELPPVRSVEVPLYTAAVRHKSIFPIQGLEQQKEQDRATIERYAGRSPDAS